MQDKYMQIDFKLPTQRIYGFGERQREFTLGEGTWTMWANGQETPYDDGTGFKQTYGVHPFCLVQTDIPSEFFGIFFRSSNAQSPIISHNSDGTAILSYITIGGNLDVNFFFQGSAKEIISQYQHFIGRPTLPPYWALGWHASAYAYKNQSQVVDNVGNYSEAGIPLEGIWLDIPYLDNYSDFTVNKTAFPDIKGFADILHAAG